MINVSKLGDYALIGNCRTYALISKRGSIDWCCFPEFHSPAIFCALLDEKKGGFFSIAPIQKYYSHQKYIDDTAVVETIFQTTDGEVKLDDMFVVMTEDQKKLPQEKSTLRTNRKITTPALLTVDETCIPAIFYYSTRFFYFLSACEVKHPNQWKHSEYTFHLHLQNSFPGCLKGQAGYKALFYF